MFCKKNRLQISYHINVILIKFEFENKSTKKEIGSLLSSSKWLYTANHCGLFIMKIFSTLTNA